MLACDERSPSADELCLHRLNDVGVVIEVIRKRIEHRSGHVPAAGMQTPGLSFDRVQPQHQRQWVVWRFLKTEVLVEPLCAVVQSVDEQGAHACVL